MTYSAGYSGTADEALVNTFREAEEQIKTNYPADKRDLALRDLEDLRNLADKRCEEIDRENVSISTSGYLYANADGTVARSLSLVITGKPAEATPADAAASDSSP